MAIQTILIVEAAHAANLSIVTEQMGVWEDFLQGRKLCAFDTVTDAETQPTHYLVNGAAMTAEVEQKYRLMASGEYMPQVVWSDIPNITEASANAAAAALQVHSSAGGVAIGVEDLLEALGLKFIPFAMDI